MDLFDYAASKARKEQGRDQVESNNRPWVQLAREFAVEYGIKHGEVCSDDIHRYFPPPSDAHPNVMGAVFRGPRFREVGRRFSCRVSAHARKITVWRIV